MKRLTRTAIILMLRAIANLTGRECHKDCHARRNDCYILLRSRSVWCLRELILDIIDAMTEKGGRL